jgi:alkylhydroperoxidase family enzyme
MRHPFQTRIGVHPCYFPERTSSLPAPFYSERERAALALTSAVTRITEGHVPDAVFEGARAHFNEQELIALVFTLTTINAWNRLAITMRTDVGNYQPKARP